MVDRIIDGRCAGFGQNDGARGPGSAAVQGAEGQRVGHAGARARGTPTEEVGGALGRWCRGGAGGGTGGSAGGALRRGGGGGGSGMDMHKGRGGGGGTGAADVETAAAKIENGEGRRGGRDI
ncbi:hypothetical protein PAHAL_8G108500 [Panicum hallii]|jgi:hypothetical protein|uniref:Uncharacterized protein n=1 Tax=Panicum hallii TaxID=206008 RepID=A0A2T8I8E6_9POAL|nr:hypothetical protein PAHAL_8G108500 [Panicum hallii]